VGWVKKRGYVRGFAFVRGTKRTSNWTNRTIAEQQDKANSDSTWFPWIEAETMTEMRQVLSFEVLSLLITWRGINLTWGSVAEPIRVETFQPTKKLQQSSNVLIFTPVEPAACFSLSITVRPQRTWAHSSLMSVAGQTWPVSIYFIKVLMSTPLSKSVSSQIPQSQSLRQGLILVRWAEQ
jgi:hypothetical protein